MKKLDLTKKLHEEILTVTFTKVDGSTRVMKCTLMPDLLPKEVVNEDKKKRTIPEHIVVAYDTEIKQWRSFNIDSVQKVVNEQGQEILK